MLLFFLTVQFSLLILLYYLSINITVIRKASIWCRLWCINPLLFSLAFFITCSSAKLNTCSDNRTLPHHVFYIEFFYRLSFCLIFVNLSKFSCYLLFCRCCFHNFSINLYCFYHGDIFLPFNSRSFNNFLGTRKILVSFGLAILFCWSPLNILDFKIVIIFMKY